MARGAVKFCGAEVATGAALVFDGVGPAASAGFGDGA